jgi:hypothetical protein
MIAENSFCLQNNKTAIEWKPAKKIWIPIHFLLAAADTYFRVSDSGVRLQTPR